MRRMCDAMAYRGPDDECIFSDSAGPVILGHRRLSIIDLSTQGRQPMTSEDGNVVLIFNGEIYNFKELRARLEARHHFRSATDSEVIVHLYEEQGPDGIVDLRGMFALGLWDRGRAQLLLARDRLGIKPLYYA